MNRLAFYIDQSNNMPIPPKYIDEWIHIPDLKTFQIKLQEFYEKYEELPDLMSISHDLTDEHIALEIRRPSHIPITYEMYSKSDCGLFIADFLIKFAGANNLYLKTTTVHGVNDSGNTSILKLLNQYNKTKGSQNLAFKINWEYKKD